MVETSLLRLIVIKADEPYELKAVNLKDFYLDLAKSVRIEDNFNHWLSYLDSNSWSSPNIYKNGYSKFNFKSSDHDFFFKNYVGMLAYYCNVNLTIPDPFYSCRDRMIRSVNDLQNPKLKISKLLLMTDDNSSSPFTAFIHPSRLELTEKILEVIKPQGIEYQVFSK